MPPLGHDGQGYESLGGYLFCFVFTTGQTLLRAGKKCCGGI
ncbi:MAG: hypothetical protein WBK58_07045 [Dethiobacteria bacterium]